MGKKLLNGLVTLGFIGFFVYQQFFQFGSKVEFGADHEVYYKSGATETDARRLGEALTAMGFFGASEQASVQVVKDGEAMVVRFVFNDDALKDAEVKEGIAYVGYQIQQMSFPGKTVYLEGCDTSFDTQWRVEAKEPPADESLEEVETTEGAAVDQEGEAEE